MVAHNRCEHGAPSMATASPEGRRCGSQEPVAVTDSTSPRCGDRRPGSRLPRAVATARLCCVLLACACVGARAAPLRADNAAVAAAAAAAAPACGSAAVDAAAAAVRAWAVAGHYSDPPNPEAPFYARSLTLGTLAALHPCATDYAGDTRARDVAVVVMGSAALRQRLVRLRREWGAAAAAAGATLFVVSDAADTELGTVVLPGATDATYAGAQNRSLMGLQHAVRAAPDARWYFMVDDDTVFNIGEAVAAVRYVQCRVPVVVGHIYRGVLRFRTFAGTWPSGGAGMLLSRAAAHAIAGALFTPACPGVGLNDLVVGRCAHDLGIPLVHHSGFQPEMEGYAVGDIKALRGVAEMAGAVSLHMINEYDVVELALEALRDFRDAPLNASAPFSWHAERRRRRRR